MKLLSLLLLVFIPLSVVVYFWVRRLDHIQANHPEYLGEDLFDDEDKIHVE